MTHFIIAGAALIVVGVAIVGVGVARDPGPAAAVLERLKIEEAFRGMSYLDSRGHPTIGWGTKLPITKAEGAWLLETRLADTHARLAKAWPPYGGLNQARQGALLDMAYELGVEGVVGDPARTASGDCDKPRADRPPGCGFHDMLAALERGDWAGAQAAALDSLWAEGSAGARRNVIAAILKRRLTALITPASITRAKGFERRATDLEYYAISSAIARAAY